MKEPNFRGVSQLPPEQADIRRQRETGRAIKDSLPSWSAGRLVPGTLSDGDEASVTHGLGRAAKGWWLVSPSGDADRVAVKQTGSDARVVKLKNEGATGTLNFFLWVF